MKRFLPNVEGIFWMVSLKYQQHTGNTRSLPCTHRVPSEILRQAQWPITGISMKIEISNMSNKLKVTREDL